MNPGKLDKRVTIQIYTTSRGDSGEQLEIWTDWQTLWANIKNVGGTESFYSQQLIAMCTHKVLTRYISKTTQEWPLLRMVWEGRILDVIYVDETRRRQGELFWLVREQVTP